VSERLNELSLPIGPAIPEWPGCELPPHRVLSGRYCDVMPFDAEQHAALLHRANELDIENRIWVYLAYGPFESADQYASFMRQISANGDPQFYTVIDKTSGVPGGVASYLRMDPANGVIEVGHINFAPSLQRSRAATEAMFLMMQHVFEDLGYRRYEWKCDALNARSRRAAERLGFTFEGTFRQAMVYKGRNRDSAWYSIIDSEWPGRRRRFERWLDPENFDKDGHQRSPLISAEQG